MTRRAYGCRLNRPAALHPSEILMEDMTKAGMTGSDLAERSGLHPARLALIIVGDVLPTPKESEALAPLFGREKRYYHKRGIEWKDENA